MASVQDKRRVKYPKINVNGIEIPEANLRFSLKQIKQILGWETETEYKERMLKKPGITVVDLEKGIILDTDGQEKLLAFADEDWQHLKLYNLAGEKVICWNDMKNRPFDLQWANQLGQDMLNKEFRLNCENVIIGETGMVTSGQHRLIGFVLAVEQYYKNKDHWSTIWAEEPYLVTLMAFGASEDQKTLQTLDNTKARTLADTFYTSDIFENKSPQERRELSKALDNAVDLLWKRTHASETWDKYQTHSASRDFLDRHQSLTRCVKHCVEENGNRGLTLLKVSPGQLAALQYLMASCASDGNAYIDPANAHRNEDAMRFEHWEKSEEFVSGLAAVGLLKPDQLNREHHALAPVREAIKRLVNPDTEKEGNPIEKRYIITKAWNLYVKDEPIDVESIFPKYVTVEEDIQLADWPDVGGIDWGDKPSSVSKSDPAVNAQQKEAEKAEKRKKGAEKIAKGLAGKVTKTSRSQNIQKLKEQYPGRLFLFKLPNGFQSWDKDAITISECCKIPMGEKDGERNVEFLTPKYEEVINSLTSANIKVALASWNPFTESIEVTDVGPGKAVNGVGVQPAPKKLK